MRSPTGLHSLSAKPISSRPMEAHEALERFERVTGGHAGGALAREAALVVAIFAALLAISTFLASEALKDVITGETRAADVSARREANDVKATVADANSSLLRVTAAGNPREAQAAAKAEALDSRISHDLAPVNRRLSARINQYDRERDRANHRHEFYELSQVGLQVGIAMAGISILAGRRWLLAGGELMGIVGVALLVAGLAY